MTKRAAIYARVSSDEQTKGFSIDTQVEAMRKYAEANGFAVVEELREDFSGSRLDRPELGKLRGMVAQGMVDAVIAYASDRFTRNPGHGLILRGELMEAGVDLHFVTRGKTEHTAEGQMFSGIEDTFSKYFRDKVMEATAGGLRGKVEAGIVPGSGHATYGYMFEGKRRETRLVINHEQAAIVRLMFRWYGEEGMTCAEVARKLTDMGMPTPGS